MGGLNLEPPTPGDSTWFVLTTWPRSHWPDHSWQVNEMTLLAMFYFYWWGGVGGAERQSKKMFTTWACHLPTNGELLWVICKSFFYRVMYFSFVFQLCDSTSEMFSHMMDKSNITQKIVPLNNWSLRVAIKFLNGRQLH